MFVGRVGLIWVSGSGGGESRLSHGLVRSLFYFYVVFVPGSVGRYIHRSYLPTSR